jgi:hypothetical protein
MMATALSNASIHDSLTRGLSFLRGEQLPSGEFPNYRNLPNGTWEYCFSPLVSAYVHDALACFDALSPWLNVQALEQVRPALRPGFSRDVTHIRKRIRRFLAWQEWSEGTWRFFGMGSGLPADLDATACAAAALMENRRGDSARNYALPGQALQRACRERTPSRETFDNLLFRIGQSNALRYFALTGLETVQLADELRQEIACGASGGNRSLFLFTLVRAHLQGSLEGLDSIREGVIAETLECYDPAAGMREPLTAAMATHVLLDLGHEDGLFGRRVEALLDCLAPVHTRRFEALGDPNCGSAAVTTAMILSAIAKAGGICE